MKDLTKAMDISAKEAEAEEEAAATASVETPKKEGIDLGKSASTTGPVDTSPTPDSKPSVPPRATSETKTADPTTEKPSTTFSAPSSGTATPQRGIPTRQAIMDKSEDEARMDAAGLTEEEKELRKREKKRGLSKEQREELAAYEAERKRVRDERVDTLAKKLIDRISIWTETDKGPDVTKAFQDKVKLEVENLKMESFGLEILHAVGTTYLQKATSFLKSQKFLGISGFFSRLKDKGTLAKETWTTISTAIDAQMTMEEMAKMEEKGGEDWTDEKKAEFERRVTGKILAAAWRGSKYEVQGVLRDVCDKVLNDKSVKMEKRLERAHAMVLAGTIYQNVRIGFCSTWIYCLRWLLIFDRLLAIQTKKAITWHSNNSWRKQLPKKAIKMTRKALRRAKRPVQARRRVICPARPHTSTITSTTLTVDHRTPILPQPSLVLVAICKRAFKPPFHVTTRFSYERFLLGFVFGGSAACIKEAMAFCLFYDSE